MKNISFTNFAVFVLFFGLALVEALERRSWISAGLFIALGVMSLWADTRRKIN